MTRFARNTATLGVLLAATAFSGCYETDDSIKPTACIRTPDARVCGEAARRYCNSHDAGPGLYKDIPAAQVRLVEACAVARSR